MADYVHIFDTTLRDGEQSPGCSMNMEEKLQVAKVLDELGVDVIEAGFPAASDGDFESVKAVGDMGLNATICGLSRTRRGDIDATARALETAQKGRLHIFIATSPIHREYKLKMSKKQILKELPPNGYRLVRQFDGLPWQHLMFFGRDTNKEHRSQ